MNPLFRNVPPSSADSHLRIELQEHNPLSCCETGCSLCIEMFCQDNDSADEFTLLSNDCDGPAAEVLSADPISELDAEVDRLLALARSLRTDILLDALQGRYGFIAQIEAFAAIFGNSFISVVVVPARVPAFIYVEDLGIISESEYCDEPCECGIDDELIVGADIGPCPYVLDRPEPMGFPQDSDGDGQLDACIGVVTAPRYDICDGLDNNCNGDVDEGFRNRN